MPAVSVVVPAFNHARFLPDTLKSVSEQTFEDWECWIVDDGSTDETPSVATRFVNEDARFRLHRQSNEGLSAARNAGLARATGEFVQLLDSDDLIARDKLAIQVALLQDDPEVDVSYCGYRPFQSETGALLSRWDFSPWYGIPPLGLTPLRAFLYRWERGLCIPIHSALFRRSVWSEQPVFDTGLRGKEDWLMWIQLALRRRRFQFVNCELAYYRLHDANSFKDKATMDRELVRAAMLVAADLPDDLSADFIDATRRHIRSSE